MNTLLEREIKQGLHPEVKGASDLVFIMAKTCYVLGKHFFRISGSDEHHVVYKCEGCGQIQATQKTTFKVWSKHARH